MDLKQIASLIDPPTARAFVTATRNMIDALMIEGQRVEQANTPGQRDYGTATLDRSAPGGGWLTDAELRAVTQRMSEAIAAEKWIDGVLFAISAMALIK